MEVDPRTIQDSNEAACKPDSFNLVSVVVPAYNEEANLKALHEKLASALNNSGFPYEIIYVDDGSTDSSFDRLREISTTSKYVTVIRFRRNFGQTAAISAGINQAAGDVLVFIDADLQNDPEDIPILLKKLQEGFDVVSGWRRLRQDAWLTRTLPSTLANRIISWVTGVWIHDYGCTLKAYRRDLIEHLRLYGDMHRFIPALAANVGASITEVEVRHHPRKHGASKYGIGRTLRVLLDLATVKFLSAFPSSPIYLFGTLGVLMILCSFVSGIGMVVHKYAHGISFIQTPLLLLSALLFLLGSQAILLGLTTELLLRTYHESQGKPTYVIRQILPKKD